MRRIIFVLTSLLSAFVFMLPAVAAPTRTFTTSLTGAEERPGPGDPNASGSATVTLSRPSARQICVSLSWTNVSGEDSNAANDAVAHAHIHEGPAGSPGPVVFTIFSNQSFATNKTHEMCGEASARLIQAIRHDPQNYYVNVHSGEYPGGAIRGQLGD